MKRITLENMKEFADKIEYGKNHFIPMLPFVKTPYHDFDRYKSYSEKGIFLIDYIGDEYCLYHLYHLTPGDDTLRATLILPSSWEKRFEIMEKSITNLKEWFLSEDDSKRLILQSLEYGEIEYFPTLSHYLIPTIIRNGFDPKYRMYMKREKGETPDTSIIDELPSGLTLTKYSEEIFHKVENFYYKNEATKNYQYFISCTYEEFLEMFQNEFSINHARFIQDAKGEIVAGILPAKDTDKIWIDNFTVHPHYNDTTVGEYLLGQTILSLNKVAANDLLVIYLNRDCFDAVAACEKNGFVAFEFWTDMILER